MHHEILILVFADNAGEAIEIASVTLENIIENDRTFDYGSILDEEDSQPVKASSKEGQELLEHMLARTRTNFYTILGRIRNALEAFSDREIWSKKLHDKRLPSSMHDTMLEMFRYNCLCIGRSSGRYTDIYDQDGLGVRCPGHLENIVNGWGDKGRVDRCWIVWADVHC